MMPNMQENSTIMATLNFPSLKATWTLKFKGKRQIKGIVNAILTFSFESTLSVPPLLRPAAIPRKCHSVCKLEFSGGALWIGLIVTAVSTRYNQHSSAPLHFFKEGRLCSPVYWKQLPEASRRLHHTVKTIQDFSEHSLKFSINPQPF